MRVRICFVLMVAFLTACSGSNDPEPTPSPGIAAPGGVTNTPIPAAPEWREPGDVITRDSVNSIELLGRLDQAVTSSTLFAHTLSPDSTQLAALSNTNLIAWDLITGQRLFSASRQGASWLYYAPDKTELYAVNPQGGVTVHNAEDGRLKTDFLGHPTFSDAQAYYIDEGLLALGGTDGTVKVWDSLERRSLVTLQAHERNVNRIVFSEDGAMLATTNTTGTVRLWDWRERELLAVLEQETPVRNMRFAPDGEQIAVGTDSFINIWRVADGEYLYTLQIGRGGASDVLLYSPDGKYLVNGGAIPDMNVWDAETGDLLALLPELGGEPVSATFSPDGTMLLASELDGLVTLWDMSSITTETVVRANLDVGTDRVLEVNWTDDNFLMLFFDAVGPVYVWGVPQ